MKETPDEDEEIHAQIIVGSAQALATWYDKYRGVLIAKALRSRLPIAAAEGAFDETFEAAMSAAHRLRPLGEGLRRFAYTVLKNQIAEWHREHKPEYSLDELTERHRQFGERDIDVRAPAPVTEAVRRCLETLRDADRQLLELLYIEGETIQALADQMAVKRNTLDQRHGRALARIRPCLEAAGA